MVTVQYTVGREAKQRRDHPISDSPPSNTLFVGNLSFEISDADLNEMFGECKNIIDVRVAIDRVTGQPRGFVHAEFLDTESAVNALPLLKGKEHLGRRLRVDFSAPSPVRSRKPRFTFAESSENKAVGAKDEGET